jgi:hypothetical protein
LRDLVAIELHLPEVLEARKFEQLRSNTPRSATRPIALGLGEASHPSVHNAVQKVALRDLLQIHACQQQRQESTLTQLNRRCTLGLGLRFVLLGVRIRGSSIGKY